MGSRVRACDMRATCLHSVLRSVLRSVEREKGRGGRGRQGGSRGTKAAGGCRRDQGTRRRQGEEAVGGVPRVLPREVYAGRVKGGRGQRDRGPGTKGSGKGGKGGRGRASRQEAGQGQGAGAERGGKEGALPRELLRIMVALAGGRRNREGRAGKRACHGTMNEQTWGRSTKVPHNRASRPPCAGALDKAERRGALPQSGPTPKVQCPA